MDKIDLDPIVTNEKNESDEISYVLFRIFQYITEYTFSLKVEYNILSLDKQIDMYTTFILSNILNSSEYIKFNNYVTRYHPFGILDQMKYDFFKISDHYKNSKDVGRDVLYYIFDNYVDMFDRYKGFIFSSSKVDESKIIHFKNFVSEFIDERRIIHSFISENYDEFTIPIEEIDNVISDYDKINDVSPTKLKTSSIYSYVSFDYKDLISTIFYFYGQTTQKRKNDDNEGDAKKTKIKPESIHENESKLEENYEVESKKSPQKYETEEELSESKENIDSIKPRVDVGVNSMKKYIEIYDDVDPYFYGDYERTPNSVVIVNIKKRIENNTRKQKLYSAYFQYCVRLNFFYFENETEFHEYEEEFHTAADNGYETNMIDDIIDNNIGDKLLGWKVVEKKLGAELFGYIKPEFSNGEIDNIISDGIGVIRKNNYLMVTGNHNVINELSNMDCKTLVLKKMDPRMVYKILSSETWNKKNLEKLVIEYDNSKCRMIEKQIDLVKFKALEYLSISGYIRGMYKLDNIPNGINQVKIYVNENTGDLLKAMNSSKNINLIVDDRIKKINGIHSLTKPRLYINGNKMK